MPTRSAVVHIATYIRCAHVCCDCRVASKLVLVAWLTSIRKLPTSRLSRISVEKFLLYVSGPTFSFMSQTVTEGGRKDLRGSHQSLMCSIAAAEAYVYSIRDTAIQQSSYPFSLRKEQHDDCCVHDRGCCGNFWPNLRTAISLRDTTAQPSGSPKLLPELLPKFRTQHNDIPLFQEMAPKIQD